MIENATICKHILKKILEVHTGGLQTPSKTLQNLRVPFKNVIPTETTRHGAPCKYPAAARLKYKSELQTAHLPSRVTWLDLRALQHALGFHCNIATYKKPAALSENCSHISRALSSSLELSWTKANCSLRWFAPAREGSAKLKSTNS